MNRAILLKIFVFFVLVIVGDQIGGMLMERVFLRTKFRFSMLYNGNLPGEIAVLGNSRGIHMFHPPAILDESGKKVANLAFNGLPAQSLPIIWEDYLARHDPPAMLILEVSCAGIPEYQGSMERLSILVDQNPEYGSLIGDRNMTNGFGNTISRLFRYNSTLMWRSLLFLKNDDQAWIMNSQLNNEAIQKAISESETELIQNAANVVALKRILDSADQAGVRVKCVYAPLLPAYAKRIEDLPGWIDWLEEELNVEIDDRTGMLKEDKFFSDHLHLNLIGAKELARRLHLDGFFDTGSEKVSAEPQKQDVRP